MNEAQAVPQTYAGNEKIKTWDELMADHRAQVIEELAQQTGVMPQPVGHAASKDDPTALFSLHRGDEVIKALAVMQAKVEKLESLLVKESEVNAKITREKYPFVHLRIDASEAEKEGALRDKLKELGWAAPEELAAMLTDHEAHVIEELAGKTGVMPTIHKVVEGTKIIRGCNPNEVREALATMQAKLEQTEKKLNNVEDREFWLSVVEGLDTQKTPEAQAAMWKAAYEEESRKFRAETLRASELQAKLEQAQADAARMREAIEAYIEDYSMVTSNHYVKVFSAALAAMKEQK